MASANINVNQPEMVSLSSLTQTPNAASQVMISLPTTQAGTPSIPGVLVAVPFAPMEYETDLSRPRVAGAGKGRVLWMAPDF
jgi:hypothetical protein